MKFGLRLQREAIPEWRTQYIDYDCLKRLLKQIPYSAQEVTNGVQGGSPIHGTSIIRNISGIYAFC